MTLNMVEKKINRECSICLIDPKTTVYVHGENDLHAVCVECFNHLRKTYRYNMNNFQCPSCRGKITQVNGVSVGPSDPLSNNLIQNVGLTIFSGATVAGVARIISREFDSIAILEGKGLFMGAGLLLSAACGGGARYLFDPKRNEFIAATIGTILAVLAQGSSESTLTIPSALVFLTAFAGPSVLNYLRQLRR